MYTVEVVSSNQTELGAEGRLVEQSETWRFLKRLQSLIFSIYPDLLKNFFLLKIYRKILGERSSKT